MEENNLEEIKVAFGKKVKSLRLQQNMTQLDLATKIGIDARQLGRIENGHTNTTLTVIYLLAEVLGVEIGELF